MKVVSVVLNDFINDNRVYREAESISELGHAVTVVALHNEGLKEYQKFPKFCLTRVKLRTRKWPRTAFFQIFKYFEFCKVVLNKYRDTNIVHCHDLAALPIGWAFKKFVNENIRVIYDAHEYQTQLHGLGKFSQRLRRFMEGLFIKSADKIITVSPSIAKAYTQDYEVKSPFVILNAPKYEVPLKSTVFRDKFDIPNDHKVFLYQGNLAAGRGVSVILDAFKKFDGEKKSIVFMGSGALESDIKAASAIYKNIYYHPAVKSGDINKHTSSADVGIHFIQNTCLNHDYCLPNKLFEYTMAGLPVIVSNVHEMSSFVNSNKNGITVTANTEVALIEAVIKISEMNTVEMRKRALSLAKIYNWENQVKIIKDVYEDL